MGSQLAARLSQSPSRTPKTNQSAQSQAKSTPSPALSSFRSNQLTPKAAPSQSTPKFSANVQSTSRSSATTSQSPSKTPTNQVLASKVSQTTKTPIKPNVTILKTASGQPLKLVRPSQAQKLSTTGITFKMVKTPNGAMYLVQEKNPKETTTVTKPTATVARASEPALAVVIFFLFLGQIKHSVFLFFY